MNYFSRLIVTVLTAAIALGSVAQTPASETRSPQRVMFEDGNYAMFIHWGLYSSLANRWKGKTYYGASEWLMNSHMAGIPPEEYVKVAADFNPVNFDARAIARLAKDAGMKYIIITSKHHEGFAMYDSETCDFNIVKSTPFGRDPMKELSEACRELGLGFGFYYSHNQDWTYPGANNGPKVDAQGRERTFDDYYREKCLGQVNEITTKYGDICLVWFDTPGGMPEKYAKELVEIVHRNQPGALVSGRVGYDMGDYQTLGDMEVPLKNIDGLWESIDVTNDSWGYSWYDENWKTPEQILRTLISTVGRGGTFMMNVGPDANGRVPEAAQLSLRAAGRWIARNPEVIYGARPSPWLHALPWGDATTSGDTINLAIYQWPRTGKLYVPGVMSDVDHTIISGADGPKNLTHTRQGSWLVIDVPYQAPDTPVAVVRLVPRAGEKIEIDTVQAVCPETGTEIPVLFAEVEGGSATRHNVMGKFGEWTTVYAVDNWNDDTKATWTFDILTPGYYAVGLRYAGDSRIVWNLTNDEGDVVQNEQGASHLYASHPMGWMKFDKPGRHTVTVRFVEGDPIKASLESITLTPVAL